VGIGVGILLLLLLRVRLMLTRLHGLPPLLLLGRVPGRQPLPMLISRELPTRRMRARS
jgi:hypothetical protein